MNFSNPPSKEKIVNDDGFVVWQWLRWFDSLYKTVNNATIAQTAAPISGNWVVGDFVRNSSPAEAGGAGSKYIISGWICTVSGTPGTWLQARVLTGN